MNKDCPSIELVSSVLKYNCVVDEELTILSVSPGMAQEMGMEIQEMVGQRLMDFVDDQEGKFQKALGKALRGDVKRVSARLRYQRQKGPFQVIPVEIVPFQMNGTKRLLLYVDNLFELRSILEWERDERVKELQCLYLLGSEMEKSKTLEELLINTSSHINNAMQFPDQCSTAIIINDKEYYHVRREQPVKSSLDEPIFIGGERRGKIKVDYHTDGAFLKEERDLISSVSKMLGRAAERFDLEKKRIEYTQSLESLVEERVRDLEKSRRRYKELFDNAPTGITITTRDGTMINANGAFYRIIRCPEDLPGELNVVQDNLYSDPEDREKLLELADQHGRVSDYEFDINARDGSIITVGCSTRRFEEDGVTYYESILKDITERKNLERKLRRQKELLEQKVRNRTEVLERQKDKLMAMNRQCKATSAELRSSINKMQTLFNAITDPVFSIDMDFNIQMTNRAESEIGKKCHQILFDSEGPCKKCPAKRAIDRKKPASIEVQEEDRFYQLQCYPLFDSQGNVEGVIEWIKDITREKNLCEQMLQQDRLASLGQLVSGIGHEINNPNTFILGNMKIIHEAMGDIMPILEDYYAAHPEMKLARLPFDFFKEHIKLLMDDMVSGAERIKTIVHDLKKFARRGEDKFDNQVSINHLINRSIRLVQNQVKRKAAIHTELSENLPQIRANSTGLEQVFVNLIINAYDAMQDGEKSNINISTVLENSGNSILVTVKDDGQGMDLETQRHIFDPFFTTKRNKGGTGLGLSIVYRIIKEHDGEIDVESKIGEGTTFKLEIPVGANGE